VNPETKKVLALALVGITALLTGYGYGRFSAPDKTVQTDHSAELQSLRQQLAAVTAENSSLKRHTVKTTIVEYAPTGKPASKKITEDTHVDLTKDLKTDVKASTDVHSAKLVEKTLTQERERPNWKVSALVGFDLATRSPVYGGKIERRILGPLSLGVWGTTSGGLPTVGISATLEF
jgi:hypothetical protein